MIVFVKQKLKFRAETFSESSASFSCACFTDAASRSFSASSQVLCSRTLWEIMRFIVIRRSGSATVVNVQIFYEHMHYNVNVHVFFLTFSNIS